MRLIRHSLKTAAPTTLRSCKQVVLRADGLSHDRLAAIPSLFCGQVKLKVEEGDADITLQDRWQRTALDEANRIGARSVAKYLEVHSDHRKLLCSFVPL